MSVFELLMVATIIGILLAAGAWVLDRRGLELNHALSDLQNLMQVSRFEAIRSNQAVLLRFSEQQVFVDSNSDGVLNHSERRIELEEYGHDVRLEANLSGGSSFRWSAQGLPIQVSTDGFAAGNITLSNNTRDLRLCLSAAGRLRRLEGTGNCQ
jgi:Tfp pilus assembly protein FimT